MQAVKSIVFLLALVVVCLFCLALMRGGVLIQGAMTVQGGLKIDTKTPAVSAPTTTTPNIRPDVRSS